MAHTQRAGQHGAIRSAAAHGTRPWEQSNLTLAFRSSSAEAKPLYGCGSRLPHCADGCGRAWWPAWSCRSDCVGVGPFAIASRILKGWLRNTCINVRPFGRPRSTRSGRHEWRRAASFGTSAADDRRSCRCMRSLRAINPAFSPRGRASARAGSWNTWESRPPSGTSRASSLAGGAR